MRRKKYKQQMDTQLLDAIFYYEAKWQRLQRIVDTSADPLRNGQNRMLLARAQYMYLLREAKRRDLTFLGYK